MPTGCCDCGQICTTVTSCPGAVFPGTATVLAEGSGTSPTPCTTSGYVSSITLVNFGTGYPASPLPGVHITGGGGSGATGHVTSIAGGTVAGIVLDDGGTGFTSPPTIVIDPPPPGSGGTQATAKAVMAAKCCVPIARSGSYLVSAAVDGAAVVQAVVSVTSCTPGATVNASLTATVGVTVPFSHCGGSTNFTGFSMPIAPVVTISGGGYSQSATLGGNPGQVTFCVPAGGDYALSVAGGTCFNDLATSVSVSNAHAQVLAAIALVPKTFTYTLTIQGCNGYIIPGATVTMASTAGYSQTHTVDGGGHVVFTSVPATCAYTVTLSHPRWLDKVFTNYGGSCGDITDTLRFATEAAGYTCAQCSAYPIKNTLIATDANGTHTLTRPDGTFAGADDWGACYTGPTQTIYCAGECQEDGTGFVKTTTGNVGIGLYVTAGGAGGGTTCGLSSTFTCCNIADSTGAYLFSGPVSGTCSANQAVLAPQPHPPCAFATNGGTRVFSTVIDHNTYPLMLPITMSFTIANGTPNAPNDGAVTVTE